MSLFCCAPAAPRPFAARRQPPLAEPRPPRVSQAFFSSCGLPASYFIPQCISKQCTPPTGGLEGEQDVGHAQVSLAVCRRGCRHISDPLGLSAERVDYCCWGGHINIFTNTSCINPPKSMYDKYVEVKLYL